MTREKITVGSSHARAALVVEEHESRSKGLNPEGALAVGGRLLLGTRESLHGKKEIAFRNAEPISGVYLGKNVPVLDGNHDLRSLS